MAASLALVNALPHALQYRWAYDGSDSAVTLRTQAELIEDCNDNATLKRLLQSATTDEAWNTLKLTTSVARTFGSKKTPLVAKLGTFDGQRAVQVTGGPVGVIGLATVEIRMV